VSPRTAIGTQVHAPGAAVIDRRFFGHPRGLSTLFFTEMWERFSYYGMRALLILFMTTNSSSGGLGFGVAKAGVIYGMYTAMVYLAGLPGGWIADRILGLRRAVMYGGILIALGHYSLVLRGIAPFYVGLLLVAAGTGLLKPNISAILGELYPRDDARCDAGFSILYMGINLGSFLAPLACGYLGQSVNWHLGFGLAALGMTFGLVQFSWGLRHLGCAGLGPTDIRDSRVARRELVIATVTIACILATAVLLANRRTFQVNAENVSAAAGVVIFALAVALCAWLILAPRWTKRERRRLFVVVVLFISALFWSIFEQAGSSLNLFAERSTNKRIWGFSFPASWLQAMNPLFIISLAPVFAWFWVKLGKRDPSAPTKFSLGLFFAGLGFAVLSVGAARAASETQVSPAWLVGTYFLHTIGELCVSPVGLSAMTKLAPHRSVGFVMGGWFLFTALGNYLGGRMASLYETFPLTYLWGLVASVAIVASVLLGILARPIEAMISDSP
jgi:proton-dependent oligopeptide transporter, POT family